MGSWLARRVFNRKNLLLVTWIAAALTVLNTVLAWVPSTPPWVSAAGFLAFSVFLVCLTTYEAYARRSAEVKLAECRGKNESLHETYRACCDSLGKRKAVSGRLHGLAHDMRDHLARVLLPSIENTAFWHAGASVSWDTSQAVFARVMDDIATVFLQLTGRPCGVCLKLFAQDPASKADMLFTWCRDRESARRRGQDNGKGFFPVAGNAAFHYIMNSEENYFLSNNLQEHQGYFNNHRSDWDRHYRAALVLPVQRRGLPDEPAGYNDLIGFLCVDSIHTDVFEEPEMVELCACIVDNMYWPLRCLQSLRQ